MDLIKRIFSSTLLLGILIGIIVGFFMSITYNIPFEDKINPVDFANLFLTLILALLLTYFIQPKIENTRVEKDLHIEQLKTIKSLAKDIYSLFTENYDQSPLTSESKRKFVDSFRSLSNQVNLFFGQATFCNSDYILVQKQDIIQHLFRYKAALTGGRFNNHGFAYNTGGFAKYESQYINFTRRIDQLILEINRR